MKHENPLVETSTDQQLMQGLNFLWLEITLKCNLTCVHCYADSSPHQPLRSNMTPTDWKQVILNAYEEGCRALQFIGGEATIYPELKELIQYAHDLGFDFIELFTNATTITDEWIEVFKAYKVNLAASFYSDEAATHDFITQRKGSFRKTVHCLEKLVTNHIPLRVGIIEMEANEGHVEAAAEFLQNLGVEEISADQIRGVGRGHRSTTKSQTNELCGQCWKGKLCVTASGDAYPCVFSRGFKVGNVKEQSINAIVQGRNLQSTRASLCSTFKQREAQTDVCTPNITDESYAEDMCIPEIASDAAPLSEDSCFPKVTNDDFSLLKNEKCGPDSPFTDLKNIECGPDRAIVKKKADLKNIECGPDRAIAKKKADLKNIECGPDRAIAKKKADLKNIECGPDRAIAKKKADLKNIECGPDRAIAKKKADLKNIECGPDRALDKS
ncbi:hypothetical protein BKI52_05490 [marine bacterium AO1-C]|nr:hypothetical protein BKI52_05490 [marine bacterium AO1-C]